MGIENKSAHSAEEIKTMQEKGEGMMTKSQKSLSDWREDSYKTLEALGVRGYLEHNIDSIPQEVFGIINGHKIHLLAVPESDNVFVGEVDDSIKLDTIETSRFLNKYRTAIIRYSSRELAQAQNFVREKVLKDIGLD